LVSIVCKDLSCFCFNTDEKFTLLFNYEQNGARFFLIIEYLFKKLSGTVLKTQFLTLTLASLLLVGCATAPNPGDPEAVAEHQEINDPAEPTMRAIFAFNQALDKAIVKPVAGTYREVTSEKFRAKAHNFLNNLRSPVIFFNDVLQGEFERAFTTLFRFLVNTTAGILGFNDVAAGLGYDFHDEDFGQTLAVWNMPEGPYLMLPIFGPSNPRDAVGRVVDFFIDPLNMWATNNNEDWIIPTHTALKVVDFRALHYDTLEDLEKSSLDFYAAIRSLYRQRRTDKINNGKADPSKSIPSISNFQEDDLDFGYSEKVSLAK
jgi:phospholipid-binding lipoprotein MlaA